MVQAGKLAANAVPAVAPPPTHPPPQFGTVGFHEFQPGTAEPDGGFETPRLPWRADAGRCAFVLTAPLRERERADRPSESVLVGRRSCSWNSCGPATPA